MPDSSPPSEQDYDLANVAQGLKGCDAVFPYDSARAYRALHVWTELLIKDRVRLEAQQETLRLAARAYCDYPTAQNREKLRAVLIRAEHPFLDGPDHRGDDLCRFDWDELPPDEQMGRIGG